VIWKRLGKMASSPRAKTLGSVVGFIWTAALCAGFVGMFFAERHPALKPVVWWIIFITFGLPFIAGAVGIVCMMVTWPGVEMAKEMFDSLSAPKDSKLAHRLTLIWCSGAGLLLSLVIGTAFALIAIGVVEDVKVWFLGVCWAALMVPWAFAGLLGRRLLRRLSSGTGKPSADTTPAKQDSSPTIVSGRLEK